MPFKTLLLTEKLTMHDDNHVPNLTKLSHPRYIKVGSLHAFDGFIEWKRILYFILIFFSYK